MSDSSEPKASELEAVIIGSAGTAARRQVSLRIISKTFHPVLTSHLELIKGSLGGTEFKNHCHSPGEALGHVDGSTTAFSGT